MIQAKSNKLLSMWPWPWVQEQWDAVLIKIVQGYKPPLQIYTISKHESTLDKIAKGI